METSTMEAATAERTAAVSEELAAWREAHKHLTHAMVVAQEAVAVAKAQRRYWLEEIAANVSPQGKLEASSVWLKPVPAKKSPIKKRSAKDKKKPASSKKRKKSDDTLTDNDEGVSPPSKPLKKRKPAKKRPVKSPAEADQPNNEVLRLTLPSSASMPSGRGTTPTIFAPETMDTGGAVIAAEPLVQQQGASPYVTQHPEHATQWATQSALHAAVAATNPDSFNLLHHIPEHLRPFLAAAQTAAMSGITQSQHHPQPSDFYGVPPQNEDAGGSENDEGF